MRVENNLNDLQRTAEILKNSDVSVDMVSSLFGKYLGEGCFRTVFEYALDSDYVIKIEESGSQCNLVEYMMWDEIQGLHGNLEYVKKWFAPVKWISPNGRLLVMKKTLIKDNRVKPTEVPEFLWDIKEDNFGWIGNNYVCHDYGQFYNFRHYGKGMKKVKFW